MAKWSSKDVAFYLLNGLNILGFQTELRYSKEGVLEDTLVLGSANQTFGSTGVKRATIEQNGFFDDVAGGNNEALVDGASTGVGSERVLCLGVEGNTKGKKFTGFRGAIQATYERLFNLGQLHKANARFLAVGAVEEGVILHELAAETAATGNTQATPVDNGASSAGGGVKYLQIVSLILGGFTNFQVIVRSSADNVTYGDLGTGALFTAVGSERVEIAGTIPRYLAVRWAFGGAGSGQSATFMTGFVRNS